MPADVAGRVGVGAGTAGAAEKGAGCVAAAAVVGAATTSPRPETASAPATTPTASTATANSRHGEAARRLAARPPRARTTSAPSRSSGLAGWAQRRRSRRRGGPCRLLDRVVRHRGSRRRGLLRPLHRDLPRGGVARRPQRVEQRLGPAAPVQRVEQRSSVRTQREVGVDRPHDGDHERRRRGARPEQVAQQLAHRRDVVGRRRPSGLPRSRGPRRTGRREHDAAVGRDEHRLPVHATVRQPRGVQGHEGLEHRDADREHVPGPQRPVGAQRRQAHRISRHPVRRARPRPAPRRSVRAGPASGCAARRAARGHGVRRGSRARRARGRSCARHRGRTRTRRRRSARSSAQGGRAHVSGAAAVHSPRVRRGPGFDTIRA